MGWVKTIKGQELAVGQLKYAVESGKVSHAYLFSGPEGVGKQTTARVFAQALNCCRLEADGPCGHCRSCAKIAAGNHPDVRVISPAGLSIKIQQVRELQQQVFRKRYEGNYQVMIVREAEKMTLEAANCLLKVLEEPPPQTVFILITAAKDSLPATVVSRCQEVRFGKIAPNLLAAELLARGETAERAELVARLADGSMGKALQWGEAGEIWACRERALNCLARLQQAAGGVVFALAEELEREQNLDLVLTLMQSWYRDLIVWQATRQKGLLINIDLDCRLQVEAVRPRFQLEKALLALHEAQKVLQQNANPRLVLEVLLFKLQQLVVDPGR